MAKKRKKKVATPKPRARTIRYMPPAEFEAVIDQVANGSRTEFGRMIGIDRRTVRAYLAGEHDVPWHLTVLLRLLAKRRVSLEDLLAETAPYMEARR